MSSSVVVASYHMTYGATEHIHNDKGHMVPLGNIHRDIGYVMVDVSQWDHMTYVIMDMFSGTI